MLGFSLSVRVAVLSLLSTTVVSGEIESRQVATQNPTVNALLDNIFKGLLGIIPKPPPATVPDALAILKDIYGNAPRNSSRALYEIRKLIENGFFAGELSTLLTSLTMGYNSASNSNPPSKQSIYPSRVDKDTPYTISELQLRSALFIPPTFTYGKKPPTILVPGTGSTGYFIYAPNLVKLFANVSYADPVWLNIPQFMQGNIDDNAEYIAYAINYVASITSQNVSVIGISQGGPATQWAIKYWPSTRAVISDFVALSPDFHGTIESYVLCDLLPFLGCTHASIQQEYNSNFITALRANGGDSAYVPTTTIYSETDEIVQPQSGASASAYLLDQRHVGVSNNDIQATCPNQTAGGFVDHGGSLYNALSYALVVDALTHPGPASVTRLNLTEVCSESIAPGLTVVDLLATESNVIVVLLSSLLSLQKTIVEPPVPKYATISS